MIKKQHQKGFAHLSLLLLLVVLIVVGGALFFVMKKNQDDKKTDTKTSQNSNTSTPPANNQTYVNPEFAKEFPNVKLPTMWANLRTMTEKDLEFKNNLPTSNKPKLLSGYEGQKITILTANKSDYSTVITAMQITTESGSSNLVQFNPTNKKWYSALSNSLTEIDSTKYPDAFSVLTTDKGNVMYGAKYADDYSKAITYVIVPKNSSKLIQIEISSCSTQADSEAEKNGCVPEKMDNDLTIATAELAKIVDQF